jgi:hypothetical protein
VATINGTNGDGTRTVNWMLGIGTIVVCAGILWLLTSSYNNGVALSRIETKVEGIERSQDRQEGRDAEQDRRIGRIEQTIRSRRGGPTLRQGDDDD